MQGDIETIESFYRNQGYLRFDIDSVQVAITPELEGIYITLNFAEGAQYDIEGTAVISEIRDDEEFLAEFIRALDGRRYSQAEITSIEEGIKRYYARLGYAIRKCARYRKSTMTT